MEERDDVFSTTIKKFHNRKDQKIKETQYYKTFLSYGRIIARINKISGEIEINTPLFNYNRTTKRNTAEWLRENAIEVYGKYDMQELVKQGKVKEKEEHEMIC